MTPLHFSTQITRTPQLAAEPSQPNLSQRNNKMGITTYKQGLGCACCADLLKLWRWLRREPLPGSTTYHSQRSQETVHRGHP